MKYYFYILIFILFPTLCISQVLIVEDDLIGMEIIHGGYGKGGYGKMILSADNVAICEKDRKDNGTWKVISNDILFLKTSGKFEYYYDLNSGIDTKGEINRTWCINPSGKEHNSTVENWRKFDSKYTYLLNIDLNDRIENYINKKLNEWKIQGEFEKAADHKKRVNQESINNVKVEYRKEAVDIYKKIAVSNVSKEDIYLNKYNPELELFPIEISDFGNFNLPVPISKAPSFKENFKGSNLSSLDFDLVNGKFTVSYFEIDGFIYNNTGATLRYDENGALIK